MSLSLSDWQVRIRKLKCVGVVTKDKLDLNLSLSCPMHVGGPSNIRERCAPDSVPDSVSQHV